MYRFLVIGVTALAALASTGSALAWSWPADGPVLRSFQMGTDAYAGGQHRGNTYETTSAKHDIGPKSPEMPESLKNAERNADGIKRRLQRDVSP